MMHVHHTKIVLGGIVAFLVVLAGAYIWNTKNDSAREARTTPPAESVQPQKSSAPTTTTPEIPKGMKEFRSEPFRFSLVVPETMEIREVKESGDAMTYLFLEKGKDFQVYVTPYGKTYIDEKRFALDQPSGVISEKQEIRIDGVPAVSFFGRNEVMGDTREVWFVRDGLLYEVTTFKSQDAWLATVMKSWKFYP